MTAASSYKGHRYPPEIIADCVWLYQGFPLSFREVEDNRSHLDEAIEFLQEAAEIYNRGHPSGGPARHPVSTEAA